MWAMAPLWNSLNNALLLLRVLWPTRLNGLMLLNNRVTISIEFAQWGFPWCMGLVDRLLLPLSQHLNNMGRVTMTGNVITQSLCMWFVITGARYYMYTWVFPDVMCPANCQTYSMEYIKELSNAWFLLYVPFEWQVCWAHVRIFPSYKGLHCGQCCVTSIPTFVLAMINS